MLQFRHLQINQGQFVVEDMLVHDIHELYYVIIVVVWVFVVWKLEVHHAHHINVFQPEIPIFAHLCLVADGFGCVKQASVLEIILLRVLHLHNETGAVIDFAIYIEITVAMLLDVPQLLDVLVGQTRDALLLVEDDSVQKTDEEFLVLLGTEQLLEAVVGVGIHKSSFHN